MQKFRELFSALVRAQSDDCAKIYRQYRGQIEELVKMYSMPILWKYGKAVKLEMKLRETIEVPYKEITKVKLEMEKQLGYVYDSLQFCLGNKLEMLILEFCLHKSNPPLWIHKGASVLPGEYGYIVYSPPTNEYTLKGESQ